MWIAVTFSNSDHQGEHRQLVQSFIAGGSCKYQVLLRWRFTKILTYDLVEITCQTSRTAPPPGMQSCSLIRWTHDLEQGMVHITQDQPQYLKNYIYSLCYHRKYEQHYSYESYHGTLEDMPVWSVYPEILREPVDLVSFIQALSDNHTLAKLMGKDICGTVQYPTDIYVMYTTSDNGMMNGLYGDFEVLRLDDPIVSTADEASGVEVSIPRQPSSCVKQSRSQLSSYASSSTTITATEHVSSTNTTTMTPKGGLHNARRAISMGVPAAPRKVHHRHPTNDVDPLEDEQWQLNVSRNLNFDQPNI